MTERTVVLISRKWSEAEISITVSLESIGIAMSLDDFVAALATEMGNPTMMVTAAQLKRRLVDAAGKVVAGMKAETARVL